MRAPTSSSASHAHRVQGGGRLDGAVVRYGLGNFLFGAVSPTERRTGVLLVASTADGPVSYEWVPGRIVGSVPQPLTGDEAAAAVAEWHAQRACTEPADSLSRRTALSGPSTRRRRRWSAR